MAENEGNFRILPTDYGQQLFSPLLFISGVIQVSRPVARGLMTILMGSIEISNRFLLTLNCINYQAPDRQPVFSIMLGPGLREDKVAEFVMHWMGHELTNRMRDIMNVNGIHMFKKALSPFNALWIPLACLQNLGPASGQTQSCLSGAPMVDLVNSE